LGGAVFGRGAFGVGGFCHVEIETRLVTDAYLSLRQSAFTGTGLF